MIIKSPFDSFDFLTGLQMCLDSKFLKGFKIFNFTLFLRSERLCYIEY